MMLTWRMLILFIHVTAVIVALGGSLFSTFALAPILADELAAADRLRVSRRVVRRLGTIVLSALGVLVLTGLGNVMFMGVITLLLAIKLVLVAAVIVLAVYQYGTIGTRIWRVSAAGPDPSLPALQQRFRKVGLAVGALVLLVVYLSLGLTRTSGGIILAGVR
jgi:uncharacterized membrane protein